MEKHDFLEDREGVWPLCPPASGTPDKPIQVWLSDQYSGIPSSIHTLDMGNTSKDKLVDYYLF